MSRCNLDIDRVQYIGCHVF